MSLDRSSTETVMQRRLGRYVLAGIGWCIPLGVFAGVVLNDGATTRKLLLGVPGFIWALLNAVRWAVAAGTDMNHRKPFDHLTGQSANLRAGLMALCIVLACLFGSTIPDETREAQGMGYLVALFFALMLATAVDKANTHRDADIHQTATELMAICGACTYIFGVALMVISYGASELSPLVSCLGFVVLAQWTIYRWESLGL